MIRCKDWQVMEGQSVASGGGQAAPNYLVLLWYARGPQGTLSALAATQERKCQNRFFIDNYSK